MLNPRRLIRSCTSVALLLAALPAHASTIFYLDQASWATATASSSTITFEGMASLGSFKDYSTPTGLAISGVNFVGFASPTTYALSVVDAYWGGGSRNFGSGASLQGPQYNQGTATPLPYIHAILPANTTSIASDLMTVTPNGLTYQVSLSTGATFNVVTGSNQTRTFFGAISDTPIAYADFTLINAANGSGTYPLMDNFQFGMSQAASQAPAPAPELSTLALIGTGLVAMRFLRRTRRRHEFAPA